MKHLESQLAVLDAIEIQSIHDASLRILARTGIKVPHAATMRVCAELGAEVDHDTCIVRIPVPVMERTLERLRAAAEPSVDDNRVHPLEGWISTQVYVTDYTSNTRRLGVLDDIKKGIALVQHLRHFPHANAVVIPSDVPPMLTDVVSFHLIYAYSRKPGGTFVLTPSSAIPILNMAREMNRTVQFLLDTVSPLQFQEKSLEIAALFAEAGQPLGISAMVMAGGSGPVTLAGTLALENAETMACAFLVHALTSRAPRYTAIPHSLDLRTMICSFGSPNQALLAVAIAQLARRYGLVAECNAGLTDSLRPDFQCGFEKGFTGAIAALAGARSVGAQGLAGADQGFSFEQLVLDNEWLDTYNYVIQGIAANAVELAEEVIASVGIGGSYLGEEHTATHARQAYLHSKLFNRYGWDIWQNRGAKDSLAKASEFVETATAGYDRMEPVCTPSEYESLNHILQDAERPAQ
jgi:trimethylamine---corrinoid protein Co-methyltransferase